MPNTFVYVDGFNLYYGALKRTPYKWLDLSKLSQIMLPSDRIESIQYFTARVSARPHNPSAPLDQQVLSAGLANDSESIDHLRSFPHPLGSHDVDGYQSTEESFRRQD
jgi:hypothetical protein